MKKLTLGTLFIAAISLAGCDSGSTDEPSNNQTALEGKWVTPCDNSFGTGFSFQGSLEVSGNEMRVNGHIYNDTDCITENTSIEPLEPRVAIFTIGSSLTTLSGLSAQKIDILMLDSNGQSDVFTEYDIFRISEGKLYIGDSSGGYDGKSEETRPVDLNFEALLTKV